MARTASANSLVSVGKSFLLARIQREFIFTGPADQSECAYSSVITFIYLFFLLNDVVWQTQVN